MVLFQYMYFIGSLVLFSIWLMFFILRKDLRKEMLVLSILLTIYGLLAEIFIWTKDWWRPQTITNTLIGVEDIIYGFALGGIVAVIYEEIFRRRHYKDVKFEIKPIVVVLPIAISSIVFFTLFFVFNLHSFYSNITGYVAGIAIIYILRNDLIVHSILTGSLLTLIIMPFYWLVLLIDSTFISKTWFLHKLSGVLILGIPAEDLVWLYFTGLFIGPLYEFMLGDRTRKI